MAFGLTVCLAGCGAYPDQSPTTDEEEADVAEPVEVGTTATPLTTEREAPARPAAAPEAPHGPAFHGPVHLGEPTQVTDEEYLTHEESGVSAAYDPVAAKAGAEFVNQMNIDGYFEGEGLLGGGE
jgi:hypothetical protein